MGSSFYYLLVLMRFVGDWLFTLFPQVNGVIDPGAVNDIAIRALIGLIRQISDILMQTGLLDQYSLEQLITLKNVTSGMRIFLVEFLRLITNTLNSNTLDANSQLLMEQLARGMELLIQQFGNYLEILATYM